MFALENLLILTVALLRWDYVKEKNKLRSLFQKYVQSVHIEQEKSQCLK